MPSTMPSASIIIPAYNAEKNIASCLQALQSQRVRPLEIIVVDDGSRDQTAVIAKAFPRVRVITQKNQGPARARNEGAKAAKGNILIFLDSDCVPEKDWLEEMLKPFEDEKVVGVQGAYKTKQRAFAAQFDQVDIETRYALMHKAQQQGRLDWIASYSAAYRKKLFLELQGFDETFPKASGEDAEFSYRLAEKGKKLVFNSRAIVYHTHPDTLGKYLKVKFFRAYWRMRMYVKHPQKMVQDSYTPQDLKVGIITGPTIMLVTFAFIITLFELLAGLFQTPTLGYLLVAISGVMLALLLGGIAILLLSPALMSKAAAKGTAFKLGLPFLLILRAIAFGLGMFFGLLDQRVRA